MVKSKNPKQFFVLDKFDPDTLMLHESYTYDGAIKLAKEIVGESGKGDWGTTAIVYRKVAEVSPKTKYVEVTIKEYK